jgi:hypothetical protein
VPLTDYQGVELNEEQQKQRLHTLRAMLLSLYQHDQFAIHDRVIEFHDKLKVDYPDYGQCRLYHLVSWSTCSNPCNRFDFPGQDSVELFIEEEYRKVFGTQPPAVKDPVWGKNRPS